MEFKRKSRFRVEPTPKYNHLEETYPHNVLLYENPPTGNIQLDELKELALERLKVLRIYEQAQQKGLAPLTDNWKEYIMTEMTREGLRSYMRLILGAGSGVANEFELEARRKDYVAHFILRLVYCRSMDLTKWFLEHEMFLFKHKFSVLAPAEIKHFLELNNLNYTPLTAEEKDQVKDGLFMSTMTESAVKIEMLEFYKVPFRQVIDLIKNRQCYIKGGYAYISIKDVISIVSVRQHGLIAYGLHVSKMIIPIIDNDERLSVFIKSLHKSYVGKDFAVDIKNGKSVSIEDLDKLAKKSYPICMRYCHEHLRAHHHLKYDGRMQYGLFLKGIGVTLEDSIRFWREEFTKLLDVDTFTKNYQYTIEHNYGKRGSMINYSPYSCLKVISNSTVSAGTAHGCPFKSYSKGALSSKLSASGISAVDLQDVMQYVSKGHYQLACGKYFQVSHGLQNDPPPIHHPNQYFEQSQMLMEGKRPEPAMPQQNFSPSVKSLHSQNTSVVIDDSKG